MGWGLASFQGRRRSRVVWGCSALACSGSRSPCASKKVCELINHTVFRISPIMRPDSAGRFYSQAFNEVAETLAYGLVCSLTALTPLPGLAFGPNAVAVLATFRRRHYRVRFFMPLEILGCLHSFLLCAELFPIELSAYPSDVVVIYCHFAILRARHKTAISVLLR